MDDEVTVGGGGTETPQRAQKKKKIACDCLCLLQNM